MDTQGKPNAHQLIVTFHTSHAKFPCEHLMFASVLGARTQQIIETNRPRNVRAGEKSFFSKCPPIQHFITERSATVRRFNCYIHEMSETVRGELRPPSTSETAVAIRVPCLQYLVGCE